MSIRFCLFILLGCAIITGCTQEQKKSFNFLNTKKPPALMGPFKYHKLVESSPGQYYDILSWGRGSKDTSSFLILHSDSSGKKYTTTTGDLRGRIVDVYNSDMDVDGHPEILIQATGKDTINYTTIYAFEFKDNKVEKLDFPKLTSSQKKGYRGNDNFYIAEGKFIREFPIYNGSGNAAKPTGAKRKLEYSINSNSFTVKQLSKDSASVADKRVTTQPVTKPAKEKTTKTKKIKKAEKKHHKEVSHKKKKKKKHRHHNSDE